MTSRLNPKTTPAGSGETFPDFPPRDDMQNALHLHKPSHLAALTAHFGNPDSTLVLCEIPVNQRVSQQRDLRIPDLLIAFNINADFAVAQNGYAIEDQGKPPDFVLEVASVTTARNDYTDKRRDYEGFGIPEYWRFDPTGGRRYDAPLAGDILVDGVYRPAEIIQVDETHLWGHSQVLNLDLCWEEGGLRWWDPEARQYLPTYEENLESLMAAEARQTAERDARMIAEAQQIKEREARIAAEARVRELEAELERRRDS